MDGFRSDKLFIMWTIHLSDQNLAIYTVYCKD
jgi:hypothetical protein